MTHARLTKSRHVFIYGPPAAGKLTVARRLAAATGFPLLDSHLTSDIALLLFGRGSSPFHALVEGLRLEIVNAAAAARVSVITTSAYVSDRQ